MRGLRQHPPGELPRPGRAAPVRPVPAWRAARPGRHRGGMIAAIDPALPAQRRHRRGARGGARAGQRRRLAWALQDRPELLTGAGAQAAVPVGAAADRRPVRRRARRRRPAALPALRPGDRPGQAHDGLRLCRNCVARSRAEPCSRCGAVREAATRDEHGRPLCPNCLITDPANQETVRRLRAPPPGQRPDPGGPLCPTCRPRQDADLLDLRALRSLRDLQGHRPAVVPGLPAAVGTVRRLRQTRPIRGGTAGEPLCSTCTRPDPGFWRSCPGCGQPGRLHRGRCARCALGERLHDLLGDAAGEIRPQLQALHHALADHERPDTVLAWLDKERRRRPILREPRGRRRPSPTACLDELPDGKPVEHLRSVLVAIGALPPRDEHLNRLEQWIAAAITERADPGEQAAAAPLRRLAPAAAAPPPHRRHSTPPTARSSPSSSTSGPPSRCWTGSPPTTSTLATARQGDLDAWMTSPQRHPPPRGRALRPLGQAPETHQPGLRRHQMGRPGQASSTPRPAGTRPAACSTTTPSSPKTASPGCSSCSTPNGPPRSAASPSTTSRPTNSNVRLRLGREPIVLPEPLADLVRQLVADRHGHATIGDQGTSRWLFPGGQPGRPISAYQLTERLRQLGLRPARPAPPRCSSSPPNCPLPCSPGCSASTSASPSPGNAPAGDWTNYAADFSRRAPARPVDDDTRPSLT